MKPKVPLGQVVATSGVAEWMDSEDLAVQIGHCMFRHAQGDWGDVCPEDAEANDDALTYGNRIMSAYKVDGKTIWILTEADRSVTTILFPEDY